MGRTSAAVTNRYAAKTYDRVALMVPKGYKAELKTLATAAGQSVNAYIRQAIAERIEREAAGGGDS